MLKEIKAVKRIHQRSLLAMKNVVACGVGYKTIRGIKTDELCIIVSVERKLYPPAIALDDLVPYKVGGVATDVVETGLIRALQARPAGAGRTDKWRPAPGGVSIGHFSITAGTLGCLVSRGDQIFILSNNHVLAASNEAEIGDPILQPGAYDGGTVEADQIAVLEDYVPVEFLIPGECWAAAATVKGLNFLCKLIGSRYRYQASRHQQLGMNLVDAAIARPLDDSFVENTILEIGTPVGIAEGELGMPIMKSGRTTELTRGQITQVDATVQVMYGNNIALFTDQLMAGEMCAGGDSGSAVLSEDNVVGLLFAGGEGTTVFNRIQNVMDELGVSI